MATIRKYTKLSKFLFELKLRFNKLDFEINENDIYIRTRENDPDYIFFGLLEKYNLYFATTGFGYREHDYCVIYKNQQKYDDWLKEEEE